VGALAEATARVEAALKTMGFRPQRPRRRARQQQSGLQICDACRQLRRGPELQPQWLLISRFQTDGALLTHAVEALFRGFDPDLARPRDRGHVANVVRTIGPGDD
jgi:hypothetical protein